MSAPAGEPDWVADVLDFWGAAGPERWWAKDAGFDAEVTRRFEAVWRSQARQPITAFAGDPRTALAAIILFDQLPRNMFRGHADAFSTDHMALAIARAALDRGDDARVDPALRPFMLMPFQHSEDLANQERSLVEFARLGDEEQLGYAKAHHDVIQRFGRFPQRNAALGRADRPDEAAADLPVW